MNAIDQRNVIECTSGIDENYLPHFCVMLEALRKESGHHKLVMHVLHASIPEIKIDAVNLYFADIEIKWYRVADDHPALALDALIHISAATYLRLLTDLVVDKNVQRLLYLDVDIAIAKDILPLWQSDLKEYSIAATLDQGISNEQLSAFKEMHHLVGDSLYFNAGVLLIDLKKVRSERSFQKALELLIQDRSRYSLADQDALNVIFWGKWKELSAEWNFQRSLLYDNIDTQGNHASDPNCDPGIIHFTSSQKPWNKGEWHPYAWLYLKYLKKSIFRREVEAKGEIGPLTYARAFIRYVLRVKTRGNR